MPTPQAGLRRHRKGGSKTRPGVASEQCCLAQSRGRGVSDDHARRVSAAPRPMATPWRLHYIAERMARIVTSAYRYKRPPRRKKAVTLSRRSSPPRRSFPGLPAEPQAAKSTIVTTTGKRGRKRRRPR